MTFAAIPVILLGIIGILYVRRRGARKRSASPAR
jgi:hypothetical protein